MAWQRPIVLMTSSATHASVNEIDGKDCLVYVSLPKFTFTSIKNSFNFSNTIAFEALRYYLNFKWFVTTLYFIYFKLFSYSCLYLILGDSKFLRGTSYTFVPSFLFLFFFTTNVSHVYSKKYFTYFLQIISHTCSQHASGLLTKLKFSGAAISVSSCHTSLLNI